MTNLYDNKQYQSQVSLHKRKAFDQFLKEDLPINTLYGALFGLTFYAVAGFRRRRQVLFFAGVGAGMATNRLADSLNAVKANESRIED